MYVRNVAGYNFTFTYRDIVIFIPHDGKIYSIPDDVEIDKYSQLKIVLPMNVRTQDVTYIRKDGEVASENLLGHKRRGRPVREKESFIIDVDINNLSDTEDGKESPVVEKPKRVVKRPAKRSKPRNKKT